VVGRNPDLSDAERSPTSAVDPTTWRKLRLRAESRWPDGTIDVVSVETLQPPKWIVQQRAQVGDWVPLPLDLTEMGLPADLRGEVVANEPCPAIAAGPGNVVLTTVNHRNRDVWTLTLADAKGRQEQVRPTGSHKFYSVSRKAWVSAKDLDLGEELRDVSGCRLTVRDRTRLPGTHTVYNMTVEGEHVYHVSPLGALVHNDGCLEDEKALDPTGRLQRPFSQTCFPAGTVVATEHGPRSIEQVLPKTSVWAHDLKNGRWSLRPVVRTFTHQYAGDLVTVGIGSELIEATGNHPFWVVEGEALQQRARSDGMPESPAGSHPAGRWLALREIHLGDILLTKTNHLARVTSVNVRTVLMPVYNFEVADLHTYAVGNAEVLVHNKPMDDDANRPNGPVGSLKKVSDSWLKQRGIDAHKTKIEMMGRERISQYDIYKDRKGNLWILGKGGVGEPQWFDRWSDE
jgi:hypothetical protein